LLFPNVEVYVAFNKYVWVVKRVAISSFEISLDHESNSLRYTNTLQLEAVLELLER